MAKPISDEALDQLTGEVLPERVVLSTVAPPDGGTTSVNNYLQGAPNGGAAAPVAGGGVAHGGAAISSTCVASNSPGTPGLLGSLGLGSSNPGSSVTCSPSSSVYGG
jgi:hypothetical protein